MDIQDPVYLTAEGKAALEAELEELLDVKRPALAARLHAAIKQGDLSENADYIAAKEEQGFLEGRIREVQYKLRNAVLIKREPDSADGRVRLGSRVTVTEDGYDEPETYWLVGSTEADPSKGYISHESPLGVALLGHRVGDLVAVSAPGGEVHFRILTVQ